MWLKYSLIEIIKGNSTKAAVDFCISDCEIFVIQPPLDHLMFHFYKLITLLLLWLTLSGHVHQTLAAMLQT